MNYKINIPNDVKNIINTLEDNGYEAYIVGGCVRDSILKRNPNDFDITTNAKPEEVIELFDKVILTGIKHGTVTVVLNNENYEITTYRTESQYEDNRHPSKVEFVSNLKEDLARRDFTINAMAYNDKNNLKDYFNGVDDLNNKIIRTVGDPKQRFNEDALRMLRAIRFSSQLNFDIESETFKYIKFLSSNIENISKERIREELNKILLSNCKGINLLRQTNLLKFIIPELDKSYGFIVNDEYNLYENTILSTQNVENKLYLKLAMIFHDLDKFNKEKSSVEIARKNLKYLRYDNETINCVVKLLNCYNYDMDSEYKIKIILNEIGEDLTKDLIKAKRADVIYNKCINLNKELDVVEKNLQKIISEEQCYNLKRLNISGKELLELGFEKGKQLGEILNSLLQEVMKDNKLNKREVLQEIAKSKLETK